jgi:predicted RNA binding protein YcfA (HicA-like mRNA interferase family)
MPKLRRLSGPDVVSILRNFGFSVISQHGSHVKLRRLNAAGEKQTLTVPNHKQLDIGTCEEGWVPLADLKVTPKSDPNYWPVREHAVWFANR